MQRSFKLLFSSPWQEEAKEWEWNPDVPTMKLYSCWDSAAVVTTNESRNEIIIRKEGDPDGLEAFACLGRPSPANMV